MVGVLVEVGAALYAEPSAVLPTQGLEWQIEYHRVADQRLQVDEIAFQAAGEIIVWFDPWIDIQLLNVDLQLIRDRPQAPYALSADLYRGSAGDQHSLHNRFQPKNKLDWRSRWYADHGDPQIRRCLGGCPYHLHCARATAQFVGVEDLARAGVQRAMRRTHRNPSKPSGPDPRRDRGLTLPVSKPQRQNAEA